MTYYFMETTELGSFRKAEALKAGNLVAAKREASRKACFYGSSLTIGTAVGPDGFVVPDSIVAVKSDGKWDPYHDEYRQGSEQE